MAGTHFSNCVDMKGKTFGRWSVIERVKNDEKGNAMWLCQCACGTKKILKGSYIRRGDGKSCGCLNREQVIARATKHGMHKAPENIIWRAMRNRCTNPNAANYARYGGRGVSVCERRNSFENFYADMGPRPSAKHSIDRRDNSQGYSPENCYWATAKQQQNNLRNNTIISHNGRTMTISEWSKLLGIKKSTIRSRLDNKWPLDLALSLAVDKTRSHNKYTNNSTRPSS